jgi:hypothetical protein
MSNVTAASIFVDTQFSSANVYTPIAVLTAATVGCLPNT